MAEFTITIPDDRLDRIKEILGKDGVPFEKRLQRAIRRAAAQSEFESFVKDKSETFEQTSRQNQEAHQAELVAKNRELAGEYNVDGDD